MLKITLEESPDRTQIKIEGRLCGPYVGELERTWKALGPALNTKQLSVDLCGMTGVDEAGKLLLAEIYSKNHAEFIARSVLTEYFAEQARQRGGNKAPRGEDKCTSRTHIN